MQPRSLEDRVTLLEKNLQGLPERMGAVEVRLGSLEEQFVQFRGEVRAEFSATREELRTEIRAVDAVVHKKFDETLEEMHALHQVAMSETRTLFEDAIRRIKITKEG